MSEQRFDRIEEKLDRLFDLQSNLCSNFSRIDEKVKSLHKRMDDSAEEQTKFFRKIEEIDKKQVEIGTTQANLKKQVNGLLALFTATFTPIVAWFFNSK